MKLTTTARHFEANPDLIAHTEKRLLKLKRFFDHILHVDVIMSVEKFRHIAEVNVHVNGHDFTSKEESEDMKVSIDKAAKSLERQMKKFKGKIISNHHRGRKVVDTSMSKERVVRSGSLGDGGGVEYTDHIMREIPEYSVEEAIILMENREETFLLFNDRDSGKLNVVYKRSDGNYGVIDTSK
ncbi:MAG: ribosome-associated translation inhibitor RaiA [bacterium]|nr:MAG: ribosome-associated translation inhibitor RaiA [bacterium]